MMTRLAALIRKEFLELRRSPQLLRIVLIAPVIQLGLLGYAATTDIHNVPIAIVDADMSPHSRDLIELFAASPYFDVVAEDVDVRRVEPLIAQGDAWLALVVPDGFGRQVERPSALQAGPAVQVIADGTDANSSGVAIAYVQSLVTEFNLQRAEPSGMVPAGIDGQIRVLFNPELESRNYMVPGVLALLLMIITTNLTSMAIVREREQGTLDQLYVTPIGRSELVLGKLLPYGLIGLIDVVLVVAVAIFWFEVPMRGNVLLLFGSSLAYLLCTLGLGLFVSTISSTQQQAMMTSTFFFLVPMIYLSGFIFPIENMPQVIQWVTTLVPLRYFLVVVRGVFLKGVGLDILWPQVVAITAWGVTVLSLAALRSRRRE